MQDSFGISGMGRIGRLLVRRLFSNPSQQNKLKAINSIYPIETIAHLLKYDTVHGTWDADISIQNEKLIINGTSLTVFYERLPENIQWSDLGVALVMDATGKFNDKEEAERHLKGGASRVILTAPGNKVDLTVVMGVNEHLFDPVHHTIISAASCTTNCLANVLHVLDQSFHVNSGWMTTVHSFTSDQNHLDNPHKDLRRARACTQSIIPTTTGVGKALKDVLPHLAPKMQGISLRVPTQDVSLLDLTVEVDRSTNVEEVKDVFQATANGKRSRFIGYSTEPLVSTDYIGNSKSAVIDGLSVMVSGKQIKVLAWYDNEWAYACRVVELAQYINKEVDQECVVSSA